MVVALFANRGTEVPSVQEYYGSLESRIGYWLFLGNTRHCGLYEKGTIWPFPLSAAQRRMEEKVYNKLGLKPGARVLDAGAGSAYVAMYMARKGLIVDAIDITPFHVEDAKQNVKAHGLQDKVTVSFDDYHNLTQFADNSFDGVYTMETFVHADDSMRVLQNFYRILKPGGVLVHHENDIIHDLEGVRETSRLWHTPNTLPRGELSQSLETAGFKNVELEDLTDEILPMWRFLGFMGYLPYQVFRLLGIKERFTNTLIGVERYLGWGEIGYISVKGVKP
ncbi:hypothetical protein MGYG_03886 [Nannizzia gypsea CBS 118893]|uniref:Methyltransferase type 11 domain-containing protein n=1 Tax=Arthroderma gypseum (strain ATCC MYA-4604 / CBS 118893) TaxID=535722 RepID=E4UUB6_ARTGP|nr:hypothetical protein MGYG_03886 [Nannizzia gypsea CBS 118893]EFR00883.1 hypothetical protein MGYG_03886 [Nannizzia gypsea CBS 118893]